MTTPDPLGVLESTAIVMASARLVSIDADKVAETAAQLAGLDAPAPEWSELHPVGKDDDETANLVLVLDALNFCFWQMPSTHRKRWTDLASHIRHGEVVRRNTGDHTNWRTMFNR